MTSKPTKVIVTLMVMTSFGWFVLALVATDVFDWFWQAVGDFG